MKHLKLFEEFDSVNEAVSQENINAMFSDELQKNHKSLVTYLKKLFNFYINRVPFGQFGVREDNDLQYLTLKIFGTDEFVTFYGIDITNTDKDFTKMEFDFDWQEGELAIRNAFEQSYREISAIIRENGILPNWSNQGDLPAGTPGYADRALKTFNEKYDDILNSITKVKSRRISSLIFLDVFTDPNEKTAPAISVTSQWGGPKEKASILPIYIDFVLQVANNYIFYYESISQGGRLIEYGIKNFDSGEAKNVYATLKESPEYKAILDLEFVKDSTTPVIAKSENMRFDCVSDSLNLQPVTAYSKGPVRVGSKPPSMVGSGATWAERLGYTRKYFLKQMITYIVSPRVEPRISKKIIDELSNLPADECYQELLEIYTTGFMFWMNSEDKGIADVIMSKIDFKSFIQKDPENAIITLKKFMNLPAVKKAFQESDLDDETKGYADDLGGLSDLGF